MRLFITTLWLTVVCGGVWASDPIVTVSGGQVRGQALADGMTVFKGIPFAAAPVGKLRWHATMPVVPWTGVRDAIDYGAPCAQRDSGWNHNSASIASEDCLFVNVWNPGSSGSELKPVMVYIHGGGNSGGSTLGLGGIEPSFDGADLASNGVVVVTISYRLGVFGFFAHPELTQESPNHSSGNYALLDQIAALEWVRDNIRQFGGDPNNVTIFGQSAGAHDIGLLMTSPLAAGLYQKAIAESGTVVIDGRITPPLHDMEASGKAIASNMGAPADGQIEFLRGLPVAAVLEGTPRGRGSFPLAPEPIIDGYVIPVLPATVFIDGKEAPVPLLIGNTARERRLADTVDAATAVREFYGPLAQRAMELYGFDAKSPPSGDTAAQGDNRALWSTDTNFRCGAVMIAGLHRNVAPTWEYEFSHAYEPRGAAHSWELRYVFGNLLPDSSQPVDAAVSALTQAYWVNFARTGNPNGASLPAWPQLDAAGSYLDIVSDGAVPRKALRREACALFGERIQAMAGGQHPG